MGQTAAPSPLWGLAWIGFAPLWIWIRTISPRQAAAIGACWGLGYYGTVLSWLLGLHPLTWLGLSWTTSIAIAVSCWGLATLWCCLIPLIWSVCLRWVSPHLNTGTRILAGVALWCALEALWAQSPLWWPDLANSQSPHNLAIAHLGQLSGITTLTAALILINGLLAEAVLARQVRLAGLAVLFGLALHGLGWGLMQVELDPPGENPLTASAPQSPNLSIGIVQGNIPTRQKLSKQGLETSVAVYRQAYLDLAQQGVNAVLLPEGALPFFWGRTPAYDGAIQSAIETAKVPLWTGTFISSQQSYTQSLAALVPPLSVGQYSSRYDKVKLVPLGEYLPFSSILGQFVQRLSPIGLGMTPGRLDQRFETAFGRAIVAICYESAFPELLRQQTSGGGQFILSVANNDPFNFRMLSQHHALDVLRAIENDRWLVRATNTGLSAVINPQGQTLWKSAPQTRISQVAHIQRRRTQTLYVKWGNWLLPTLVLSSLSTGIANQTGRGKRALRSETFEA